jgi:hypothetical protein
MAIRIKGELALGAYLSRMPEACAECGCSLGFDIGGGMGCARCDGRPDLSQVLTSTCEDMRAFYSALHLLPTSEAADCVLIRSHIAYHAGAMDAERAEIKASRGHSYKVSDSRGVHVVRILDHFDHRTGVVGWAS